MSDELSPFEIDLLRNLNGEPLPQQMRWGAAMGAALGPLTGMGYLKKTMRGDGLHYDLTDKARDFLAARVKKDQQL